MLLKLADTCNTIYIYILSYIIIFFILILIFILLLYIIVYMNKVLPVYIAIAREIEEKISSRKLMPGDRLPTEEELSNQYKVARATLKKALTELVKNRLIIQIPGRGTYVT
ncbi:MAG TPA: hypothetical protein DC049_19330, partial [Spirochaetia bacterium]|nr:hypothetical protein [Spirochaetia bacterium]